VLSGSDQGEKRKAGHPASKVHQQSPES